MTGKLNSQLKQQIKSHLERLTSEQIKEAYQNHKFPFSAPHYRSECWEIVKEIANERYLKAKNK